jgi:hypothetical protein
MRWIPTVLIVSMLGVAGPAVAQQPGRIDADRLPVNVPRIKRQLQPSTIREEREGLNLRYFLNVYGQGPRLQLFTREDNLASGPAPYGAPTHKDFIEHWTPQEFRAPVADVGAVMQWLSERLAKKKTDR